MGRDVGADPASTEYWNRVGDEWIHVQRDALWREYCDARNTALVGRWLPGSSRARVLKTDVFDEAVSDGLYPMLRQRARRICGLDISPVILQAAKARYPEFQIVAADVRCLPFDEGTFDAVVSLSTLDHFDSLEAMRAGLVEIHRVMLRGGGLLITVDNDTHPAVALRNRLPFGLVHKLGLVPYRVGKTCGGKSLQRLLTSSGFDVRALTYVEHCPRVIAVRVARALARTTSGRGRAWFSRALTVFERLERWPARAWTGHYVAAWAVKP